jgi:hypothetical protein
MGNPNWSKHKYHNKPTEVDGFKFQSKKEAKRYEELRDMRELGEVLWFMRQPPFDLPAGVKYRADFLVFWKDGSYTVEDVKGFKTDIYILKKKLVEAAYPFKLIEI